MPQKPKREHSRKKQKTFYRSTPKKNKKEKRNPENEIHGIYKQAQWNFGFVDTIDAETGKKQWYYVHESKKLDALEGDEVAFEVQRFRGKPEAIIKKVLKRSERLIVGTLQIQNSFGFVTTENQYVQTDIFIPGKSLKWYESGDRVGVQIINWKWKKPEGRIMEKIPKTWEKWADIMRIALEWGARITFPEKVMSEVRNFSDTVSKEEINKRRDMRNKLTFTIDGADSKDLDDAISIEKTQEGNYKLFVHIADVAHYVAEDSELDREARKRGTSIYLVNQVIPMLPPELSNGLCSLHPWEAKLTLTCEMTVNQKGHILNSEVYESVIDSNYRLTYKDVQSMITPDEKIEELEFWRDISKELWDNISTLHELKKTLEKYKNSKGVLHFDFPETKIEVDENENPIRFYEYERYESHKIIEECMILANEAVAQKYQKYPFLYRVHESPDEEDVEKFALLLKKFDVDVELTDISSKSFQNILKAIEWNPKSGALQKMLLRTLMKARYSEKNHGHFGLASSHYSHFTSPIRRYPDLQIHRIMKEILQSEQGNISIKRKEYYKEILPKVAIKSSDREVLSEKLEYRVRDYMAVKYMKDKVWEKFTAKISGMIEKWFFVELPNTIEGFVSFSLSGMSYDAENFMVWNPITGDEYTFWDEVEVELIRADSQTLRLDFGLVVS